MSPRGTPVPHHDLELAGVGFRSPVPVEIEGADQLLGLFGARPDVSRLDSGLTAPR